MTNEEDLFSYRAEGKQMTDEDLKDAERLAKEWVFEVEADSITGSFIAGYAAATEKMRAEIEKYRRGELYTEADIVNAKLEALRLGNELEFKVEAERARSVKLVKTLDYFAHGGQDNHVAENAIAEYEASK